MVNGRIKIGEASIAPNTSNQILKKEEFNIVNLGERTIYISKSPQNIENTMFWVTYICSQGIIKKIELNNADENYRMNYSNMNSETLLSMKNNHEIFLRTYLGEPDKKSIGSIEYLYSWGRILSFLDNKTGDCGILIRYN